MPHEYSPYKALYHREALLSQRPVYAIWDFTGRCNQACVYCISKYKELFCSDTEWELENIYHVSDEMWSLGIKAVLLTGGGEPLMYKHFSVAAKYLLEKGFDLALATNGELLQEIPIEILESMSWIRVSLDAYSPGLYQKIRSSKCDIWRVLENVLPKLPPIVGSSYIVHDENIDELIPFLKKAKITGLTNCRVTYSWLPTGIGISELTKGKISNLSAKILKLSDTKFQIYLMGNRILKQNRDYSHCYYSDAVLVIGSDSNVYRCCPLKYTAKGLLGCLLHSSLSEIWKKRGKQDLSQCPLCFVEEKNKFIEYLLDPIPRDVNFI